MKTAAVIIVPPAGQFEPTREICGLTPVHWLTLMFQIAGTSRVIVTGGEHLRPMVRYLGLLGAYFIIPKKKTDPGNGLISSLRYLENKCDRVLVIPAEFSLVEANTVRGLIGSEAPIEVPTYNGRRGWPVKISREHFDALIEHKGELTSFLGENAVTETEYEDAGVTTDISRRKKPELLAAKLSYSSEIRPIVKVVLARSQPFFGPGTQQLIRLMEENQSLNHSGTLLGMALTYSRKLVEAVEKNLGIKLYRHERKGRAGGYSYLTEEIKDFCGRYEAFAADCKEYAEESFKRHFGDAWPR